MNGFVAGLLQEEHCEILRSLLDRSDLVPLLSICRLVGLSEGAWVHDLKCDLIHLRSVLAPLAVTSLRCPGFSVPVRLHAFAKNRERTDRLSAWITEPASMLQWMSLNRLQDLTPVEAIRTMNGWLYENNAVATVLSNFLENADPRFDYVVRGRVRSPRPIWVIAELRIHFKYRNITGLLYTREFLSRPH